MEETTKSIFITYQEAQDLSTFFKETKKSAPLVDQRHISRDLLDKLKGKDPTPKQIVALCIQVNCILVRPDGRMICISCDKVEKEDRWKVATFEMKDKFVAVGSGSEVAIGAMDRGASAVQAVRTAIKYNSGCGGDVQVLKLGDE